MADLTFNTTSGATIDRELLIAYLNTSATSTPTWSPLGKRVTDSSIDVDWSEETNRDILGSTYTTLKKPTMTQTFEPNDLDGGDTAIVKLWNLAFKDQDYAGLANLDVLIVHFYAGTASTPFAERYSSCAISPSSLGGEGGGHISMPISITFGGTRTVGTASKDSTTGAITFSAAS
ncbi:MAG: hypothetical protein IKU30_02145 [Clostridia bacterium]|nr:hypothetical protein [Clostridia bacterium]MBR6447921.1 hypothetical protein [Methanomicrobium sp.]